MPRRPRLQLPGVPLHIIQRGNNRSACFFADQDYHFYLERLREQAGKHGCDIHAYVLMTNHVHLLLTPKRQDSASLVMKHLGQRYVQYINREYQRSGTLWEGRYRSCLVDAQSYLFRCMRYIELNPVRAEMVKHPGEYRWSSYSANAQGDLNSLLTPHEEYLALGSEPTERQAAYRELFRCELEPGDVDQIRKATNGNFSVGSERFKQQIEEALGRRVVPGKAGRPKRSAEEG